ncbi:arginase [Geosporobacter ferrireducens]|uniref:Arginase n=1 Tax=Geosporobacter ferrireducens TaxID=1424294 RepID=A0A1D8GHH3_9FIRM|nr:arginase [Geosporobacter ferrireducens]AOT70334.1 arginase [Geosporobacter ferrireducens]MTI54303.1 arginase [Geosporobacter ferrireducens]
MNISLIGVPMNYGCDREGAQYGPEKLREKKIVDVIKKYNHSIYDFGNLYVPKVCDTEKYAFHNRMKYLKPIVEVNTNLAHQVYSALAAGNFPFVIGGDHSLGLGSIAGASKYYENLAVVWIDAHGDINTDETSPSGNVHGMPLAAAMGVGCTSLTDVYYKGVKVRPENVFIIGARDLDEGEVQLAKDKKLNLYTMDKVKYMGVDGILKDIVEKLKANNVEAVHLSFDMDALDSDLVPGTGTPVTDGMTIDEVKYVFKHLMDTKLVKSMDLVELNTHLDKNDVTAEVAIDLVDWTFKLIA